MGEQDVRAGGEKHGWVYEDIVSLPHHEPKTRPRMAMEKRAAQFAPFAALTGYDDVIGEAGRLTEAFHRPDEDVLEELNRRIRYAMEGRIRVTITWFSSDSKKAGGAYRRVSGVIKKAGNGQILMEEGEQIPAAYITNVEPGLSSPPTS